jgi:hypothetical protein
MMSPQDGWSGSSTGGTETEQRRLNGHQRDTLAHIFRHPLSHNLEWHAVISLLEAIGDAQETHKGHLLVTIGGETDTFEPRHKDIDAEQLALLRKLLKKAGYGPEDGQD